MHWLHNLITKAQTLCIICINKIIHFSAWSKYYSNLQRELLANEIRLINQLKQDCTCIRWLSQMDSTYSNLFYSLTSLLFNKTFTLLCENSGICGVRKFNVRELLPKIGIYKDAN
jgi:hypothetical protein